MPNIAVLSHNRDEISKRPIIGTFTLFYFKTTHLQTIDNFSDRVGMVVCSLHTVVEATCDSWKTAKKTFIEMSSLNADRASAREKFNFYNTLAVLLKAVEGHKTTIDLRNESYITGIVNHADGYMNVEMKDCIFTDSRGDSFKFEMFFVQARNIRFVHIPPHMPIIPAIKDQLHKVSGHLVREKSTKLTGKQSRVLNSQRQGLADVKQILEERKSRAIQGTSKTN